MYFKVKLQVYYQQNVLVLSDISGLYMIIISGIIMWLLAAFVCKIFSKRLQDSLLDQIFILSML